MKDFLGLSHPTLIGSFPGKDHEEALSLIFKYCPEIPCWPQLPSYPQEGMLVQFSKGLPGFDPEKLILDPQAPNFETEMLTFYEEYLAVKEGQKDISQSRFALDEKNARGFFLLVERLGSLSLKPRALKGQVTGPFTLATGLKTPEGKAPFYDETLRDLITKTVAMKAAFQVETLKKFGLPTIIFLDEPALAGFGSSSFVGVSREEVISVLKEVAEEVKARGGIVGTHVCANTEWDLLIEAGLDIINFDAFDYLDRFLLYASDLKAFLDEGGNIAWGLVPTLKPEVLKTIEGAKLIERFERAIKALEEKGASRALVLDQALFTPSCGMGTLPLDLVPKALSLLREVAQAFQAQRSEK